MEQIHRIHSVEAPKLIAHRGFAVGLPQNSVPAFEKAGQLGYWAIETDVHLTADGVLVCCHDATVDSMFLGSGAIREMKFEDLRRLEFRQEKRNGCHTLRAM
jgi:glycerophosphoryl diester phosphodiesterase